MEMLNGNVPAQIGTKRRHKVAQPIRASSKIFDDSSVTRGYESVPLIDIDVLPRGGISFETKAVGRIQVCWGVGHVFIHFLFFFNSIITLDSSSTRKSNVALFLFHHDYYYFSLVFLQKRLKIACC
jgi:hypothetical protein